VSDLKRDLAALRLDPEPEPTGRWKWALAILLLVLALCGAAAWWASRAWAVVAVDVTRPSVSQASAAAGAPVLTAAGYLIARRDAVVSAKIQGRLAELRVEEGSEVARGEVLARLESQDYEAQVERSKAQVARALAQVATTEAAITRAEADLAEQQRLEQQSARLVEEGVVPTDQLDAARSRVRLAEAALAQARADRDRAAAEARQARADVALNEALLQNTVIAAPFAGTVVKKMAEVGESVAPIPPGVNISTSSGAIVALADLSTLEMEADVSEANVARLVTAQPAEVTVEAFPERTYRAVLRQIIPTADRTKATVQVKVTLVDKDARLKPEMSAKVTFLEPMDEADAAAAPERILSVPRDAVVTRDGVSLVFEVVENVARRRPIVAGASLPDRVIVKSGLSGDETLVASPPATLKDGDQVAPRTP
jgi:RND family efflux transporter MFP subunit